MFVISKWIKIQLFIFVDLRQSAFIKLAVWKLFGESIKGKTDIEKNWSKIDLSLLNAL